MKKYTWVFLLVALFIFNFNTTKALAYTCTATTLNPTIQQGQQAKVKVDVTGATANDPVYVFASAYTIGTGQAAGGSHIGIIQTIDSCTADPLFANSCQSPFMRVSTDGSVTFSAQTNNTTDIGSHAFNIFCSTNRPLGATYTGDPNTSPNDIRDIKNVGASYNVINGDANCELSSPVFETHALLSPGGFSVTPTNRTATYPIKNDGVATANLAINSPTAGVTATLTSTSLAPGATTQITVNVSSTDVSETFNVTSSCGGATYTYSSRGGASVLPHDFTGPPPPPPISLYGDGDFPVAISGSDVTITEGQTVTRDVVVGNPKGYVGNVKIYAERLYLPPGVNATFSPTTGTLSTGESFHSKVTFKADGLVLAGTYKYQLTVKVKNPPGYNIDMPTIITKGLIMTTQNLVIPGPVSIIAKPKSLALDPFRIISKPSNSLSKANGVAAGAILALAASGSNPSGINTPPKFATFSPIPSNILSGQKVSFTWSATDANNDDLLWGADWGDTSSPTASVICPSFTTAGTGQGWTHADSHTWASAGSYTVTVFVSDCRGPSTRVSFTVNVGQGTSNVQVQNPNPEPNPNPSPAVLTQITITPAPASIQVGGAQSFTATGRDQNGAIINSNPVWSSSNTSVATINASGVATALALGTTTISAKDGNITGTAVLTVAPPATPPPPPGINTLRHSVAKMLSMRIETPGQTSNPCHPFRCLNEYDTTVGTNFFAVKSWTNPAMILDKALFRDDMGARYYSLADPMNPVHDSSKDLELMNIPAGDYGAQMYPYSIAYSRDGRYEISNAWNNGTFGSTPEYPVKFDAGIPIDSCDAGCPIDIFQSNSRVYYTYLGGGMNGGGAYRLDGWKKSAPYYNSSGALTFNWIAPDPVDTAPNIPSGGSFGKLSPSTPSITTAVMSGAKDYVAVLSSTGTNPVPKKLSIYAPTENDPIAEIDVNNASAKTNFVMNMTSFVTADVQYVMFTTLLPYLPHAITNPADPNFYKDTSNPKYTQNQLFVYKFDPKTNTLTKVVEGKLITGEIGGGLTHTTIAGIRVGDKDGIIMLLHDNQAKDDVNNDNPQYAGQTFEKPNIYMFDDLAKGDLKDVYADAGYSIPTLGPQGSGGAPAGIASLNKGDTTYVYLDTVSINNWNYGIAVLKFDPSGINVKPVTTGSTTSSGEITHTLRRGSTGPEVVALQEFLNENGYDVGTADGSFGAKTEDAVKAFQLANGLSGDGVVGPLTRALMH